MRVTEVILPLRTLALLLCIYVVLAACASMPETENVLPTRSVLSAEEPLNVGKAFLSAWCRRSYNHMHGLISPTDQATYSVDDFIGWYEQFAEAATFSGCRVEVYDSKINGAVVDIGYKLHLDTDVFGQIVLDNSLKIVQSEQNWFVDWSPQDIINGFVAGGQFTRYTVPARRGTIFDEQGRELAVSDPVIMIAGVPSEIQDPQQFSQLVGPLIGLLPQEIVTTLVNAPQDWLVPLGQVPPDTWESVESSLVDLRGLRTYEDEVRRYPYSAVGAHLTGYLGKITAEQLQMPENASRSVDDSIGQSGVEAWGDSYLAGVESIRLIVTAPTGELTRRIADKEMGGSHNVHLTIDIDFQHAVEELLGERKGAIVVLEPQTGVIRALVSYPSFDPNQLVGENVWEQRGALLSDPDSPLLNRATQAALPPGSTFKIVTMAAGLNSGLFSEETEYTCTGSWEGLGPELRKRDWKADGHGTITLHQALVVSCNPYFFEIGLRLYEENPDLLPTMARHFGFGSSTGLIGVEDNPGLIPDTAWKMSTTGEFWWAGEAVNMATGQGDVLATPLQIANMMAGVANGGIIYRPTVVKKISGTAISPEEFIQPQIERTLPLSLEILDSIRASLAEVTLPPYGTAARTFADFPISVAGKTGTAETPQGVPHAWFASYAPVEEPQVVVVVMIEHGGEGSTVAAPLARQVYELYFDLTD